jgi:hypothetical protein
MIRRLFLLLLLVAMVGGGLLFASRAGLLPRFSNPPEAAAGPVVSVEAATSAREKLQRLEAEREPVRLTDSELSSLFSYHPEVWAIGGAASPVVRLAGDSAWVTGSIAVDRLPSDPTLDALRPFLPDTAQVELSGTVRPFDDRHLLVHVAAAEVAGVPIPPAFMPQIMDRLGRPQPPGLPADAFVLPLPPGVGSAAVENGEFVISPEP